LAAANKRIRNILKKLEGKLPFQVKSELLEEGAERALATHVTQLSTEALPLIRAGFYQEALMKLAALQEPVDQFFDQVMVMVDNAELRDNRIALLNKLQNLFMQVADFSRLQS
jgi:glycyl-tRNA synthetase beta chain